MSIERVRTSSHVPDGIDFVGQCEDCDWYETDSSRGNLVKKYQDHLREHHPKQWLRK